MRMNRGNLGLGRSKKRRLTAKDAKVRQGNAGKIEPRRHSEHNEEETRESIYKRCREFSLVVSFVPSWFNYLVFSLANLGVLGGCLSPI
jgi:hypothetical protein